MTDKELADLKAEFPEGIPPWMLDRGYDVAEVRRLMLLRRKAFPSTKPKAK